MLKQADDQRAWTNELKALLPEAIRRDCKVVDLRGPTLVIACRNAGAATRLRFLSNELVESLQHLSHFAGVQRLHVQVATIQSDKQPA